MAATLLAFVPTAAAAPSAESRRNEATRWTLWYVRIHNQLIGKAFGQGEAARHARMSFSSPGVLRFTHTGGTITGRIRCVRASPRTNLEFGCRWAITAKRRGFYWGLGLINFYKIGGFNYQAAWSRCRPLVRGSRFCRRYPPPKG